MSKNKGRFDLAAVILLTVSLLTGVTVQAEVLAKTATATVYIDNKKVDITAYNINGNNYFKLRDLAEALNDSQTNFSVEWDSTQNAIMLESGKNYISQTEEKRTPDAKTAKNAVQTKSKVYVDGQPVNFEGYTIEGNNYFKLRDVLESFSISLTWAAEENAIYIATDSETEKTDESTNTENTKPMHISNTSTDTDTKSMLNAQDIYDKCSPAVFYIETYDMHGDMIGSGSGFFVDDEGTAVTNFHMLENAFTAKAILTDKRELEVKGTFAYDKDKDLAIIKVDGTNFHSLQLGISDEIKGGEKIYTLGSPLGLSNTISEGIVSTPKREVEGHEYIQISAPISLGSSGGALINAKGQAVGVTTAGFFNGQNLNFAVGTDWVRTTIAKGTGRLRSLGKMAEEVALKDFEEMKEPFSEVIWETEPNNNPTEGQYIENADSIIGFIDDNRPDWFYTACNVPGTAAIYCYSDSPDFQDLSAQLLTDNGQGIEGEFIELEDGSYALYAELSVKKPCYINIVLQSKIDRSRMGNNEVDYTFYYEFVPDAAVQ